MWMRFNLKGFVLGCWVCLVFTGCSFFREPPPQKVINLQNIKDYAWMALLAYEDDDSIQAHYEKMYDIHTESVTAVQGRYIILTDHKKKQQYLVFRGTANTSNMLDDVRFDSVRDNILKISVHRGFQEHASAVFQHIRENSWQLLDDDYDTICIGHSLGGATAALIGAYLIEENFDVRFVVTFGQPKFTDPDGSMQLKALPLIRVTNHGDIVPDVPLIDQKLSLEKSYDHLGLELMLLDESKYMIAFKEKKSGEKPSFIQQLLSKVNVENHLINTYLAKISDLLNISLYPSITVSKKGWWLWGKTHFDWIDQGQPAID